MAVLHFGQNDPSKTRSGLIPWTTTGNWALDEAEHNANSKGGDDQAQRVQGWDLKKVRAQHFHADQHKDGGKPVVQIVEQVQEVGQGEVESAQTEDCENIGGEYNVGLLGHGQHGGDGIDGKDEVRGLDHQQDQRQGGEVKGAIAPDCEVAAGKTLNQPQVALGKTNDEVIAQISVILFFKQQLEAGVKDDGAEDVVDPVEVLQHGKARGDEEGPHHDGAEDPPEEHLVLQFGRDFEVA